MDKVPIEKLDIVAFLKCKGIEYTQSERHGRRVVFLYDQSPELNQALSTFLNRTKESLVDPQEYNAHYRDALRIAIQAREAHKAEAGRKQGGDR